MKLRCFTAADRGNAYVVFDEDSRAYRIVKQSGNLKIIMHHNLHALLEGVARGTRHEVSVCKVNRFLRKKDKPRIQESF